MTEATVFIVDDDEAYRDSLVELVSSVGLANERFASALDFLAAFDAQRAGCLVLDVRMARLSGLELQARLKAIGATLPIVFISGHGDIEMAVKAIRMARSISCRSPTASSSCSTPSTRRCAAMPSSAARRCPRRRQQPWRSSHCSVHASARSWRWRCRGCRASRSPSS
jgi:DNA-binding NtrC family response regulator